MCAHEDRLASSSPLCLVIMPAIGDAQNATPPELIAADQNEPSKRSASSSPSAKA